MLLRSEIGSSPFDALNTGVAEVLGVPLSVAIVIAASSTMVIGVALGGTVGPLTVALLAGVGVLIDAAYNVLPTVEALLPRCIMFGAGLALTVAAVALQVNAEIGPGPGEVLMLGFVKQGLSVRAAKWVLDAALLVIGVLLGGVFGVGTAIMMVAFAPLLARMLRLLGYVPPASALEGIDPTVASAEAGALASAPSPQADPPLAPLDVVMTTGPVPVTPALRCACD